MLLFENHSKTADFIARATFSALIHIDNLGLPDLTSDGLDRALTCARSTTNTLVRCHMVIRVFVDNDNGGKITGSNTAHQVERGTFSLVDTWSSRRPGDNQQYSGRSACR